jgi:hypothetical protein
MVRLDGKHQADSKVALARAIAKERRDRRREDRGPCSVSRSRCLARCVVDERIEARAIERHPHRREHLARALGEGAQHSVRAVVGVLEGRLDEASELRPVGLEASLRRHDRGPSLGARRIIPTSQGLGSGAP